MNKQLSETITFSVLYRTVQRVFKKYRGIPLEKIVQLSTKKVKYFFTFLYKMVYNIFIKYNIKGDNSGKKI
jgi:hypothetical protein